MKIKNFKTIQLCSRCITNEINNWVNEKAGLLDTETTQKIREELKSIKLKQGECIVCNNNNISADCSENILKILEKNKTKEEIKKEFVKMFGFEE